MSRTRTRVLALTVLLALLLVSSGCQSAPQPETQPPATEAPAAGEATTPEEPASADAGEALARQKCTMCHSYDRVEQAKKDRAGWEATIDRMVQNGLVVTPDEKQQITDYLVERDQ